MKTNSAINLLRFIGGTAAKMLDAKAEKVALNAFMKKYALDNPKDRGPKLARQYKARYGV